MVKNFFLFFFSFVLFFFVSFFLISLTRSIFFFKSFLKRLSNPFFLFGFLRGRQPFCIPCYKVNPNVEGALVHSQQSKEYYWSIEIARVWDCESDGNPTSWPEEDAVVGESVQVMERAGVGDGEEVVVEEEGAAGGVVGESRSSGRTKRLRRIECILSYEHRGKLHFVISSERSKHYGKWERDEREAVQRDVRDVSDVRDERNEDNNDEVENEKERLMPPTSAVSITSLLELCTFLKDHLRQKRISNPTISIALPLHAVNNLRILCQELQKIKPKNVVQLCSKKKNLQKMINHLLGMQQQQQQIQHISEHGSSSSSATPSTIDHSVSALVVKYLFQRNISKYLFNSDSVIDNNRRNHTTMFDSTTLCCAESNDKTVPNYWRAGHMCLEKNTSTSVVSIVVYCTRTSVPILVVPLSSVNKCYRIKGGGGGDVGYELQLCTSSRSHGPNQIFTFIVATEQLCEEWTEIIRTKACL